MTEHTASTISLTDYLGIDPKQIPAITTFVDRATSPRLKTTADGRREPPLCAAKFLTIAESVAAKSGMSVIIAEISVLADAAGQPSDFGNPFFTTNIVCRSESMDESGLSPVLKAYMHAIGNISRDGTTMNTPEFHALHCVYISSHGPAIIAAPNSSISFHRVNVPATPLASRYREENHKIDFERHHRDFFEQFIKTLGSGTSGENVRLHYMAVPFQRPEHLSVFTDMESPARLEPAGAIYLILQANQDHESYSAQIDTIAARLQYICALSCLKASSLVADRSTMVAKASEATLIAYDGIGHALREFVEATGYEGAIALLATVQHDYRLPPDLVKPVARVGKSLAFFEHAEALGSLMRLHGWLKTGKGGLEKIIGCFDEAEIQSIREGQTSNDAISAAAADVIVPLAAALAYKDENTFQIQYKAGPSPSVHSVLVPPDFELPSGITAKPTFVSLKTERDDRAVLLALIVALLEPLRNASIHLVRSSSNQSLSNREVAVLVEGYADGAVKVYIGNKWHGKDSAEGDILELSTGIQLVGELLRNCHLGNFFKVGTLELTTKFSSIDPANYRNHVWIGIEATPLTLYDFANDALKAI